MDLNLSDVENLSDQGSDVNLTLQEVIQAVEEAWTNEKFAPEILPNKIEYVEILLSQISYIEENIRSLDNGDFQKTVYQLEAERLRFMITSYLRTRLEKIETYVLSILKQEDERREREQEPYLTKSELEFATNYKQVLEDHFDDVLSFWRGVKSDDWKKEPVEPNISSFVFFKSKGDIEGVVIDDDDGIVDLQEGTQMLASYKFISTLVKSGAVCLI